MRFLFTFVGGTGHFLPTEPFARELSARGHRVLYACQPAMVEVVIARGFEARESGGNTLSDPAARLPLVIESPATIERAIGRSFAGSLARRRAVQLIDIVREWRPDALVRDEVDFAGAVVAEMLDIPHAAVTVLAAGNLIRPDVVAESLRAVRDENGLAAGDAAAMAMLHHYLTLVPVPPSFRSPLDPLPATAHHVRPAVLDGTVADEPAMPRSGARPLVYFTLGTIFHQESGDLFGRVLAGLRELPLDALVSVGPEIDPAELGEQPESVRVVRFAPAAATLAECSCVVSHAGSGTVIGAMAFARPQVLLPIGADQILNSARCRELGVGEVLDVIACTPQDVADTTAHVLAEPSYRRRSEAIREEILSLPRAAHGADLLEQLAADRRPLAHV